jgi:hypothetical protein
MEESEENEEENEDNPSETGRNVGGTLPQKLTPYDATNNTQ